MTNENEFYFQTFVFPHVSQTLKNDSAITNVVLPEEKTVWARLLTNWLLQNKKKMQIRVVEMHEKFFIAIVSILCKEDGEYVELIQSICVYLSINGFENCFKDLYLNTKIGGTEKENADGKNVYTLTATVLINDRYLLSTGHLPPREKTFTPFAGTVAKFRTLSDCVDYINTFQRNAANTQFIVSKRLDDGVTGECCSSLQIYDISSLSLHSTVFPQYQYRLSDANEKIEEKK